MEFDPKKSKSKRNIGEIKTISVPYDSQEIKENLTIINADFSEQSGETILKKAFKFHSQRNFKEAEKYYHIYIMRGFKNARVFSNYGCVLKDLGKFQQAEKYTQKAIALQSDFEDAYYNLANIYRICGKLQEARFYYKKAIDLKPDFALAHAGLALILLNIGNYDLSLIHFSRSTHLLRGQKFQVPNKSRDFIISKAKIEHDIEQFEYLVSHGYEVEKFTNLANIYKKLALEIIWESETKLTILSEKYKNFLMSNYNLLLHQVDLPVLENEVVNNQLNVEEITNKYYDHEFGLTFIDNFLSLQALESLRKFLLGSTIWFDVKRGGYLGAYLKEGLANPLIIQIAEELRTKFPKIFKDHPINQIWAFKYDSGSKNKHSSLSGIKVHADFAAINVNFWITPNEANLNPDSGGLIVYDVEAPRDWDFNTYNNDEKKIREELKKSKGSTKVIPHKENRAVIFNSNLFHETDNYEFKNGYENRRINVTILYGFRT
tara:strand:+ start:2200 stop:3669 length:1470 start_codon:yes stop_codon:yes gene_type:complete